jgi:hypothetical protein
MIDTDNHCRECETMLLKNYSGVQILQCTKGQTISLTFSEFSHIIQTLLRTVCKMQHHLNNFVMCLIKRNLNFM